MNLFFRIRPRKLGLLCAVMMSAQASAEDVTLAWDPSPDTNVVAYRVYYGAAAGAYGAFVQVAAPATTAVVGGLLAGATHFFTAKAVDAAGVESDSSNEVSFQPVVPILENTPPTLNPLVGMILTQNPGPQVIPLTGITAGATIELQTLTVTASSSVPARVPNPTVTYTSPANVGTLVFTPGLNAIGWSTLYVTVDDGGSSNNTTTQSFWVLMNNPPTLNPIANMLVDVNGGEQSVALSGITSGATNEFQPLSVIATSSNPSLIPNPTVSYSSPSSVGTLRFTPAANASGVATITVTARDGQYGNNSFTRTLAVTVRSAVKIASFAGEAFDARNLKVSWSTDTAATCVLEYGTTSMFGEVCAATVGTAHSVTLTNLAPGTLYHLLVRATTESGSATALATAATEARQLFQWAAENATFSGPIKVYTNAVTENGKYVASSVKNKPGTASYNLNLPKGPNYRMWARVKTSLGGGTFGLSLDGSAERSVFVTDTGATDVWHWAPVMEDANRTNAANFAMQAGAHTFLARGAVNAWWDEFVIVNDPQWQPILPTTRPTLTAVRTSATTATLSWTDPSGNATNVGVEYSTDGINFTSFATVPATQKTLPVTNLIATTYFFRVYSYNSVDRTAFSNVAAALNLAL